MGQEALLCTVDALISEKGVGATQVTSTLRASYRNHIIAASRIITRGCRRFFVPEYQTRLFDARGEHIDSYRMRVDGDLLEIATLTNGDGNTISSGAYVLRPDNTYPKNLIQLKSAGSTVTTWTYSAQWEQAISVAGFWGYHEFYTTAWINTLETVPTGGLTAAATSFTAVDADGTDNRNRTRFQDGMYLKIDSEIILVAEVDTGTNVITIRRAQQGTTAAIHAQTTPIYNWAVEADIEQAALGHAVFLLRNKGNAGEVVQMPDGSELDLSRAPDYVRGIIKSYRRQGITAL